MTYELLIQHQGTIMLPPVVENVSIEWERQGQPGKLIAEVVKTPGLSFQEGDPCRFSVDGSPVFYGFVFEKSRKGSTDDIIQITVYDQLYYLKNKDTYVYTNKTAADVIRMIAEDFQLNVGDLEDTGYTIGSRVEDNQTLFDIIQTALDETLKATSQMYVLYDDVGKLTLKNIGSMKLGLLIDEDTAGDFDYCNNHSYNKNATRTAMIKAAANQSPPVFGFDCVCLIKGILWGWDGDASRTYGGAGYAINGVPDIGADTMITKCTGVSTTGWDDMVIGEAVWMSGHIGIYIGDGLAVECSPKWENKVQITAVGNIGSKAGYNTRRWTKHGKLPYVDYTGASTGGGSQGTTQPSKPSEGTVGACVGDTVTFTGNKHYVSSNALNGSACKPGKAKVTAMAGNAKHPYHLIKVPGGGSTVYGWVDAADIQVEGGITVGSKVKVNKGAKTYTGGGLASFVYTNTYTVIQVDGDRVVIGQNGVVTAAVNSKDLTLVG